MTPCSVFDSSNEIDCTYLRYKTAAVVIQTWAMWKWQKTARNSCSKTGIWPIVAFEVQPTCRVSGTEVNSRSVDVINPDQAFYLHRSNTKRQALITIMTGITIDGPCRIGDARPVRACVYCTNIRGRFQSRRFDRTACFRRMSWLSDMDRSHLFFLRRRRVEQQVEGSSFCGGNVLKWIVNEIKLIYSLFKPLYEIKPTNFKEQNLEIQRINPRKVGRNFGQRINILRYTTHWNIYEIAILMILADFG